MAKAKSRYVCQACGSVANRWQGQCADCAEWNTLIQEIAAPTVFSAKHDLQSGGRAITLVGLATDFCVAWTALDARKEAKPSGSAVNFAGITAIVGMPPTAPAGPNAHIPSSTACESCHLGTLANVTGQIPANAPKPAPDPLKQGY